MSAAVKEQFDQANERVRENLPREHGFEDVARIEGELPGWFSGTLYRNGPGLQDRFGQKLGHSFEGDGAVTAVRVEEGRAQSASRFVRTPEFLEEERQGKLLYGLGVSWFRRMGNTLGKKAKNPANVNVMRWQGKLLAVAEGGAPYLLDPDTLETLGAPDMNGLAPGYHSPHPHRIDERKASYSFRLLWGRQTELSIFSYPDEGRPRELTRVAIDGAVYIHDFIATRDHLVFFIPPVRINILRAMSRIGPLRKIFGWKPELGTKVIVVPIDSPEEVVVMDAPAFHVWHYANAFTRRDGELFVDFSYWPDFSSFDAVGSTDYGTTSSPDLRRARIDLGKREFSLEVLTEFASEFPSVAPAAQGLESGLVWSQTETEDRSGVMSCDLEGGRIQRHLFDPGQVASEPNFAPRPGGEPDEGVLSTLCYDLATHTSFLAMFDAQRVEDGPQAKIWLDHHVPMTFHGFWE